MFTVKFAAGAVDTKNTLPSPAFAVSTFADMLVEFIVSCADINLEIDTDCKDILPEKKSESLKYVMALFLVQSCGSSRLRQRQGQ